MSEASDMHWTSAYSERVDSRTALREAVAALDRPAAGAPDLVLLFVSPHHASAFGDLSDWVREELGDTQLIGVSAASVIGAGNEIEGREGLSITAAWLPGTTVKVQRLEQLPATPKVLSDQLALPPTAAPHCILLLDQSTCEPDSLLRMLDQILPSSTKLGGVGAPIGKHPCAIFDNDGVHRGGGIICMLEGACEVTTLVAQGCRPVGEPFIVTRSRGNVITELSAGKPTEVLRKVYESMNAQDQALFNTSLFIGIEMGGKQGSFEQGDFLIRNVLGIDRESGAMATDARLGDYQVIQFHLRDRNAASEDLVRQLRVMAQSDIAPRARGALLFSCLGRGERLYGAPNHDSDAFLRRVPVSSLSGFFCNGEIGPVGGKTYLHGYTSVFGVFSVPAPAR